MNEGASTGLLVASDIVRYIFSFIPSYSFSFSLMALTNVQTVNNVCINNVDPNTLKDICQTAKDVYPKFWLIPQNYYNYITCCTEEYVPNDIAVCNLYDFQPPLPSSKCHEITSMYTFDKLDGINESLLWLCGTCLLYMGILVLIESGIIRFLISRSRSIQRVNKTNKRNIVIFKILIYN